jgi:hypothetical protein
MLVHITLAYVQEVTMQPRIQWDAELDQRLKSLRASGLTWDAVALEMAMGRNTVLERGRRLGARRLRPAAAQIAPEPADRPARPPGHPATWGLITDGTSLEGQPYPYPVFL